MIIAGLSFLAGWIVELRWAFTTSIYVPSVWILTVSGVAIRALSLALALFLLHLRWRCCARALIPCNNGLAGACLATFILVMVSPITPMPPVCAYHSAQLPYATILEAVGVGAVCLPVAIVVLVVETLAPCFRVGVVGMLAHVATALADAPILEAVRVGAVFHAITVVVFAIKTLVTSLVLDLRCGCKGEGQRQQQHKQRQHGEGCRARMSPIAYTTATFCRHVVGRSRAWQPSSAT